MEHKTKFAAEPLDFNLRFGDGRTETEINADIAAAVAHFSESGLNVKREVVPNDAPVYTGENERQTINSVISMLKDPAYIEFWNSEV